MLYTKSVVFLKTVNNERTLELGHSNEDGLCRANAKKGGRAPITRSRLYQVFLKLNVLGFRKRFKTVAAMYSVSLNFGSVIAK